MISHCSNPECGKPLRYLRDGRVVRMIRPRETSGPSLPANPGVEHFWLCGDCYRCYDFSFLPNGSVRVNRRLRDLPVVHEGHFDLMPLP
jgi:hypothetical protein